MGARTGRTARRRRLGTALAVLAAVVVLGTGCRPVALDAGDGRDAGDGVGRPCPHERGPRVHDCRRPKTVTLSGTAYTFNTRNPIPGAWVGIDELPHLSTTTAADGNWSLEVPSKVSVTPFIRAAGHAEMHVQTFHPRRDPITDINFQTPTQPVYGALEALVTGYLGRSPFEGGCVIVTTVSDPKVVDMTFDEFIHFAPHGVAGATAYGVPALPQPIYFNDHVIPDPAQQTSSGDGGVLFPNVPPGVYEVHASHPDVEFDSFTATCVEGRLINANPPQGLHGIPAG